MSQHTKEHQNIEWKESWHNDYFKGICGFANAQGGTLFIGINDKGQTKHLNNAKKLLEDLPNLVRDLLGLMVDVNLHTTNGEDFLEIVVEPYPFPISLRGKYYYRSGSTLQELKGAALSKFLLQRQGKKWDGVPIPNITADELKNDTFDFFRKKGTKSKRLEPDDLGGTNHELLESLQLYLEDEKMLKRAAILLFHPKPEKYVTGAYIKIGYFENEADLMYQDEMHGNLFEQIEQTMDLLFTKYIKALISYEGISRVETYEYPREAIREALLNAVAHKDYSGGAPIQIKVYKDRILIWNDGQLPDNWTVSNLLKKHASKPYNPDIANTLFRSGYIESWGRGIEKMMNYCLEAGIPSPNYSFEGSDFLVEFRKDIYHEEYLLDLGLNERQIEALLFFKPSRVITSSIYQEKFEISERTARYDLVNLVERRLLLKIGDKKSTKYEYI
ncbi:MAG: putative DNA binding domain-containing protein [Saprospiraceae bacterium]|nr:putative DNA binding domain-containing protein [Saprospiraceae bacterium]MBK8632694.1 putative DNA binding domain-containing protein [Saprospiraceae bacterium]MBP7643662.1 putative DNA binding domain-containing protein [Saprospiraceae bacterium]HMS68410.1 ATP-binding protein [Saprospiraceae bacterium]